MPDGVCQGIPVQFGGAGLVEFGFYTGFADGVEETQGADAVNFGGIFGHFERDLHVRLGAEVINFTGMDFFDQAVEVTRIGEIAVMEEKPFIEVFPVIVYMIDAEGVEGA